MTPSTLVFYEAPHRIVECIDDAREVLGNRQGVLARELTKLHEEVNRGRLSELAERIREKEPRGEYVLLIGPRVAGETIDIDTSGESRTVLGDVDTLMQTEGIDQKAALKRVAKQRGLSKREAYRKLVEETRSLDATHATKPGPQLDQAEGPDEN